MTKTQTNHKKTGKPMSRKRWLKMTKRKRIYLLGLSAFVLLGYGLYAQRPDDLGPQLPSPPADAPYRQASTPLDARVQDLLARMTLEEKIGQMALVDKNSLVKPEDIHRYYIGGLLSGAGAKPANNTPEGWLEMTSNYKAQTANSRLGIPIFYGVDANHGHANMLGATVFPHAIGLGAARDPALVRKVAEATANELAATGVNWNFAPSLDAPKDIRWGRVYEAFSDDAALNAELGAAHIHGSQSQEEGKPFVLASAKHFLGTGSMVWGKSNHKKFKIDQGVVEVNEKALRDEYLLPYRAAVDAGVGSVMVALNEWGDTRMIDSKYLITDILKDELGFKGIVVSDWYGVYEYAGVSNYQANVKAINAGLDMAMLPYDYKSFLFDVRKAVRNGDIAEARINDAVSRILYQKFKAGLFDPADSISTGGVVGSEAHRALAREAAAAGAVLLKNNDTLLPLNKDNQRILIAGSGADNVGRQAGAWTIEWQGVDGNWMPGVTSILDGIRGETENPRLISYDKDANFNLPGKAAVGIAIVSEKPYAEGWGDNPLPTLEQSDAAAIEALRNKSEKLIIVVVSGRPLLMRQYIDMADAVVAAWLPGSEGAGVADVLFGNRPFSGKLPVTWPAEISQVPVGASSTPPLFRNGFSL